MYICVYMRTCMPAHVHTYVHTCVHMRYNDMINNHNNVIIYTCTVANTHRFGRSVLKDRQDAPQALPQVGFAFIHHFTFCKIT